VDLYWRDEALEGRRSMRLKLYERAVYEITFWRIGERGRRAVLPVSRIMEPTLRRTYLVVKDLLVLL
jgi:hypothetical protein